MKQAITWVGLDAHARTIVAARLFGESDRAEVWEVANTPEEIGRLARRLRRESPEGEIRCCYEAGPVGYELQRLLEKGEEGIVCEVIAPSLIPRKPGDRVKTDRRDARKLARLYRAGELTTVWAPTEAEEAVRDLCRCRQDAREDAQRARHRLGKFLLRRGLRWEGRAWTREHWRRIRSLTFERDSARTAFEDYVRQVEEAAERVSRLEREMEAVATSGPYAEAVGALRCFRGIYTVTALTLAAELYAPGRFRSARALMAWTGLVPSERSSGGREKRGGITKTGNGTVRRLLIESAWHARRRPHVSKKLRARREGRPAWAAARADRAMERGYARYWRLVARGKAHPQAATACARELCGFVWSVLARPGIEGPRAPLGSA